MSVIRIANRYAKSIFQLALERGSLEDVNKDIKLLNTSIKESRDFYLMLKSPIIQSDKKMAVINGTFKGRVGEITSNFLEIIVRKGREGYLPDVIDSFIALYNQHKNITPVVLVTAASASDDLIDTMKDSLRKQFGLQEIEMETKVDEDLIGGYILRYEDKMVNTSISRGLALLRDDFDNNDYIRKF